ncbi:hypothetical protein E0H75_37325 [Kribbella capetownensis]|uniref:Uncharacterized protein n=1 Tax=Kribbella capetownensis TaxID=1572659 RepID=A0A4R0JH64_9ACTN|nr:hypothetical protein E0H75_37325 [Kribbella capetownensis]
MDRRGHRGQARVPGPVRRRTPPEQLVRRRLVQPPSGRPRPALHLANQPRPVEAHPTTPEPVRPGAVRPGAVRPGAVRPGAVRPGAVRPGAVRPGAVRPGAVRPGAVRPGAVRLRAGWSRPASSRTR